MSELYCAIRKDLKNYKTYLRENKDKPYTTMSFMEFTGYDIVYSQKDKTWYIFGLNEEMLVRQKKKRGNLWVRGKERG